MASGYCRVLRGELHRGTAQAMGLLSLYLYSGEGACHVRLGHSKLGIWCPRRGRSETENSISNSSF